MRHIASLACGFPTPQDFQYQKNGFLLLATMWHRILVKVSHFKVKRQTSLLEVSANQVCVRKFTATLTPQWESVQSGKVHSPPINFLCYKSVSSSFLNRLSVDTAKHTGLRHFVFGAHSIIEQHILSMLWVSKESQWSSVRSEHISKRTDDQEMGILDDERELHCSQSRFS